MNLHNEFFAPPPCSRRLTILECIFLRPTNDAVFKIIVKMGLICVWNGKREIEISNDLQLHVHYSCTEEFILPQKRGCDARLRILDDPMYRSSRLICRSYWVSPGGRGLRDKEKNLISFQIKIFFGNNPNVWFDIGMVNFEMIRTFFERNKVLGELVARNTFLFFSLTLPPIKANCSGWTATS